MIRSLFGMIFLVPALLTASLGYAQQSPHHPPLENRREQVFQLIITRLATGLQLNETQTRRLESILKKYKEQKKELYFRKRELTQQLRTEASQSDEKAIQKTLKSLEDTRNQIDQVDDAMFAEVKPMLTPRQQAQFVLIMEDIRHEVRAIRYGGGMERPRPVPSSLPGKGFTPPGSGKSPVSKEPWRGYQ